MAVDLSKFKLTKKQEMWLLAYCSNGFNGTAAARTAGYKSSGNALNQISSENRRKPHIKAALEVMYREMKMSTDEILTRLTGMAVGEIPTRVTLNEKQGDTITYDAGKAISILAPVKLELTGKDGGPIEIDHAAAARDILTSNLLSAPSIEGEDEEVSTING